MPGECTENKVIQNILKLYEKKLRHLGLLFCY